MAPFTPFFAEELYRDVGGELDSVHLEEWPEGGAVDKKLLDDMDLVRKASTLGLEKRMASKVNVRQPLAAFNTTAPALAPELAEVLRDEINVKEIRFGAKEDSLDLNITAELKEEGDLRELLRKIQDMRKEKGLTVNDPAILIATDAERALISKHETEIKKATRLSVIEYGVSLSLK
jgi:isoleucyl-tRNA synthetase